MRTLLLGIDSGTQSTKVLVVDARDGKVLASAAQSYELIPNLPPGAIMTANGRPFSRDSHTAFFKHRTGWDSPVSISSC